MSTTPGYSAELAGHLRTNAGTREAVIAAGAWTPGDVSFVLPGGDVIRTALWPFAEAVIWMQGVIRGTWATSDGVVSTRLVIVADDHLTRIASDDCSRVLELPTDPLHDAIRAAQATHETTPMRPPWLGPHNAPADIDRRMAELIAQLWALDAITTDCCEDLGGRATITFEDAAGAETFIDAVLRAYRPAAVADIESESVYNRIVLGGDEPNDWQEFRKRRMWRLKAQVREYGAITADGQLRSDAEPVVAVTVDFPIGDIEVAITAVRDANSRRGVHVTAATYATPVADR